MAQPQPTIVYRTPPVAFWPIRYLIALGLIVVGFLGLLSVIAMDKIEAGCIFATGVALFL